MSQFLCPYCNLEHSGITCEMAKEATSGPLSPASRKALDAGLKSAREEKPVYLGSFTDKLFPDPEEKAEFEKECENFRPKAEAVMKAGEGKFKAWVKDRVSSSSDIMSGEECFSGTRIPIKIIANLVERGVDRKEIKKDYPSLSMTDISFGHHYIWKKDNNK